MRTPLVSSVPLDMLSGQLKRDLVYVVGQISLGHLDASKHAMALMATCLFDESKSRAEPSQMEFFEVDFEQEVALFLCTQQFANTQANWTQSVLRRTESRRRWTTLPSSNS